ncbi:uncharacterized protein LOC117189252 isoform X1 [Drosophila miranda]|uniref:uncharacterized protein LOC117189222 n=2 Tax=Drosophila miranda TaxID=7229 RepID=UPI00143F2051|nr:uncharacterized protein LOC117189222 [Drosophila miranda]XP_033250316.1 uncharacterized protein LOC117189252 isoform X1 [Drosophila miranda]
MLDPLLSQQGDEIVQFLAELIARTDTLTARHGLESSCGRCWRHRMPYLPPRKRLGMTRWLPCAECIGITAHLNWRSRSSCARARSPAARLLQCWKSLLVHDGWLAGTPQTLSGGFWVDSAAAAACWIRSCVSSVMR